MATPFLDAIAAIGDIARLFPLNETSGTTAADLSANEMDGTYAGSPSLNQTKLSLDDGQASVDFDGIDDKMTVVGNDGANLAYPFSFVALVKTDAIYNGRHHIIVWSRTNSNGDNFGLGVTADGYAIANCTNSTPTNSEAVSTVPINDGNTHLVVAVFASTTSRKIYVDGLAPVENTDTSGAGTFNTRTLGVGVAPRSIGPSGAYFSASRWFEGQVEYAGMLNKALSDAEVLSLYNAILPWARLSSDSISVADAAGGEPDNVASLFDGVSVFHPTDGDLTATLVIADDAVVDIDGDLPDGWTDAGSGTYTATARDLEQMADDLQALQVIGLTIDSTTATLTLTDESMVTSEVVVDIECVDTDFSVVIEDGGEFAFGTTTLNTPKSKQFRFINQGNDDWVIDAMGVTVTGTGFSLDPMDDPSGDTVTPGNEVTATVIFEPTTVGAKTGLLSVAGDQDDSPYTIDLDGEGVESGDESSERVHSGFRFGFHIGF